MGGYSVPGPVCQETNPVVIDRGTSCLAPSPQPGGSPGASGAAAGLSDVEAALAGLQAEAQTFAWRFINDAKARQAYVRRIADMSQEILADVRAGRISASDAARLANESRNLIMEEIRRITSAIGRSGAQAAKASGLTLEQALAKAVDKLYPGRAFAELSGQQKRRVFTEVVEAAGRSSSKFTSQIPKWLKWGRSLGAVTVAISIYNIWAAENRLHEGIREGATLAGSALGGAAANAGAGFLCGPGAPVCVTALFIVGGIAGALVFRSAATAALDQQEIVRWLGE